MGRLGQVRGIPSNRFPVRTRFIRTRTRIDWIPDQRRYVMSNGTSIPGILEFKCTAVYVKEQTGVPGVFADNTVLARDKAFYLCCDFDIGQWLGQGLNNLMVGGAPVFEYNITWYAEHIGPGDDYKFPPGPANVTQSIPCIAGQYSYVCAQTTYTVPANAMQEGEYELKCRVKMSPAGGGAAGFPFHVVASKPGPDITIYQP